MAPTVDLPGFRAWTARAEAPPGYVNGRSANLDVSRGHLWPNRGYEVTRQVATATDKPAASWTHRHNDDTEWPIALVSTALYAEQTDGTSASIVTGLTETWQFAAATLANLGTTFFLNGTDAESKIVRKAAGGELEAVAAGLVAPGVVTPTTATTGGSLSDGTYHVRHTWIDDAGVATQESAPSSAMEVTLSAGTATQTIVVGDPGSAPAKATKRRIYLSVSGDVTTGFLRSAAMQVAAGSSYTITEATSAMTTAVASRNSVYRQAGIPLSGANIAVVHMDRIFIASTTSNKIYWSERDSLHWYSTNRPEDGMGAQWNGAVRAIASAFGSLWVFTADSVYRLVGDFSRDSSGDSATFAANARADPVDTGIGAVSSRAITVHGTTVFFMSTRGPAMMRTNGVALLAHADVIDAVPSWDWTNMARAHAALDRRSNCWCLALPRLANSSRPQDGAAVAGIPDMILRFDLSTGMWALPLTIPTVDLVERPHGTAGTASNTVDLYAMGPHGSLLRLNRGWTGGEGVSDVSGTNYDGILATANTSTTADIGLSGVSSNALVGRLVMLYYPTDDSNFPGDFAIRVISANTSGQVTWTGALTTPSSTKWTVRIASLPGIVDVAVVPFNGERGDLLGVDALMYDVVGAEAAS